MHMPATLLKAVGPRLQVEPSHSRRLDTRKACTRQLSMSPTMTTPSLRAASENGKRSRPSPTP